MIRPLVVLLQKAGAASLLLLASQLILFLGTKFNSDILGEIQYGRFGLAMSVSAYASQFIQWGLDQYLTVRFVRGSVDESRRLYGVLLRQKQIAALLVLAAGALASMLWATREDRDIIFLGAVDGVAIGFLMPSLFDASAKTALFQFYAFLRHAAYVGAMIALASFAISRYSPLAVLGLHAFGIMFEVVLEQLWIQKNYGPPVWPVPARETLPLWRDAAPMALAVLAQQALYYLGVPAMRFFDKQQSMGALYLSNQFTFAAASFITAPAALVHARLAGMSEATAAGRAAFRKKVWLATLAFAAAGIVYTFAFDIAGRFLAAQFFEKLTAVPEIISVDAWRLVPIFASVPLASALICRGHLRAFAIANIMGLLAGVAIAVVFIPRYDALGAAGAIAGGRFVYAAACAFFVVLDKPQAGVAAA